MCPKSEEGRKWERRSLEEMFRVSFGGKADTWKPRAPCGSNQSMVAVSTLFLKANCLSVCVCMFGMILFQSICLRHFKHSNLMSGNKNIFIQAMAPFIGIAYIYIIVCGFLDVKQFEFWVLLQDHVPWRSHWEKKIGAAVTPLLQMVNALGGALLCALRLYFWGTGVPVQTTHL